VALRRDALDDALARVNEARHKGAPAQVESADPSRFVLSFPNRMTPEGECIDQDFSAIQWILHEKGVDTGIQGGRLDEASDRYFIEYEVIEW